jgi:hypothetical protein
LTDHALVCANHPNRETSLRCNRCNKPICTSCAVHTPVGYRCKECVRGQQKGFDTAHWWDYIIAFVIAAVGVGIAITILGRLFFWLGFIFAPIVGGVLAELIQVAIRRRRSRYLPLATILGGTIGVLFHLMPLAITLFLAGFGELGTGWLTTIGLEFLFPIGYGFLMVSSLYYRLRGIRW